MKIKERFRKLAEMGCIICSDFLSAPDSPAEIHHLIGRGVGKKAPDDETIPLCPLHHRLGDRGVAVHSGKHEWERIFATQEELLKRVNRRLGILKDDDCKIPKIPRTSSRIWQY